jgi:hypothetical protein
MYAPTRSSSRLGICGKRSLGGGWHSKPLHWAWASFATAAIAMLAAKSTRIIVFAPAMTRLPPVRCSHSLVAARKLDVLLESIRSAVDAVNRFGLLSPDVCKVLRARHEIECTQEYLN